MDNAKLFTALLNGITKKLFENNALITPEYLKTEIFSESSETIPQIEAMIHTCEKILIDAASQDMELSDLETQLKQNSSLNDFQQETFLKFWRTNKMKIHESVADATKWNNSLNKMSWRIDSKTKTRTTPELNELTAIVELTIGRPQVLKEETKVVRFEMDKNQLDKVLFQINSLQQQLSKFS